MKKINTLALIVALALGVSGCEKILTFYPEDESTLRSDEALTSPDAAQQLLNSVYDVEANFLGGQMQNLGELLSDNIDDPTGRSDDYTQVYNRRTDFFNGTISGVYRDAYIAIYRANVLLAEIDNIPGVTADFAKRVTAEARFIRALNHYMVVRLFAQPYGATSDNSHMGIIIRTAPDQTPLPRSSVGAVYNTIISDLEYAEANLPTENGPYATSWSAKGLLAKVYLEMGNFTLAEQYADEVIAGPFALDDLDRFEGGGSSEYIFYVKSTPPVDERGTGFKNNYRSDAPDANPTMRTNQPFYDFATTDTNDLRGKKWFRVLNAGASNQSYAVAKYDFAFMDVPVIHLTEIKLIKAECRYEAGDYTSVAIVLNELRLRAGVPDYTNLAQQSAYTAVHNERRLEMCFEGDRTFQLKRQAVLGRVTTIRNAPWNCNGMALQFPNSEGTGGGFIFNPEGGCN